MEKKISLNGLWQGVCADKNGAEQFRFDGTVPGCVHTDLAGTVLDYDIFYRDNNAKCQWIEDMNFEYSRSFTLEEIPENAELVFEGLDVYCEVFLNGNLLGRCEDMFITHRFPLSGRLSIGENRISVVFRSPIAEVEGKETLPAAFTAERLHTRRMQCTYGWDWVARFVTCGIFRDVYIRSTEGLCAKNLYVYTTHVGKTSAQVVFEAEFENFEKGEHITAEILSPLGERVYSGRFYVNENHLKVYVDLKNPKLWYPHGYGEQPLYTLKVGEKSTAFGIRVVRIVEEKDEVDSEYYKKCLEIKQTPSGLEFDRNTEFSGFVLTVNDLPIMCKGGNWVPCEPFPSAETPEKITKLLELGKLCGVNMLRVWGGGIFEQQHFYDECDRLGILVTQDFLMACGKYPEEDENFLNLVRKETEQAAYTLRNHPCLMWWSGDNENAFEGSDDAEDYRGRRVTHESIMPVLNRLDPQRRFLISSPYGGNLFPSKTVGTTHNSQYLGNIFPYILDTDMTDYKEYWKLYTARFIVEEPAIGSANLPTLRRFMTDEDIFEGRDIWLDHSRGNPALSTELFDYAQAFASKVLGEFKDGADRFFKLKYLHYEWVRITFETARRNKGFCNGLIYWMFDDCWPAAVSWSIVDYYCNPKPAFYSFKRAAKEVVASVTTEGDRFEFYVSNDALVSKKATLKISAVCGKKAEVLYEGEADIPENRSFVAKTLPLSVLKATDLIIFEVIGEDFYDRAFWKQGALPLAKNDSLKVVAKGDDFVTVTTDTYIHAVEFEGEYLFEDNYFSLLPCETRTIKTKKLGTNTELKIEGWSVVLEP